MALSTNPKAVYMREWSKNNRERAREIAHASYERNKATKQAYDRIYRIENAEKRVEYNAKYYGEHKDSVKARVKEWCNAHSDLTMIYASNRRAKAAGSTGRFTLAEWNDLKSKYGHKCLRCGRTDVSLTADHVIPLRSGGSGSIENIQPLCLSCNCRKRSKTTDYRLNLHA